MAYVDSLPGRSGAAARDGRSAAAGGYSQHAPKVIPFFLPNAGCPARCVYCDQRATLGSGILLERPEQVEEAVRGARGTGVRGALPQVAFFGGTFTRLPVEVQERFLGAAGRLVDAGEVESVRVSTHPAWVTESALDRLRRFHVRTVELGVQSLSDGVLGLAGRGYSGAQAEAACRAVMGAGFALVVQLMLFLPGAREEDDLASARRTAALARAGVRLFPTVVLAGTELARWWREGRYAAASVEEAAQRCASMLEVLAGCEVLRVGLQVGESVRAAVVAGPLHPAFGELAWGALMRRVVAREGARLRAETGQEPEVIIDRALASMWCGHGVNLGGLPEVTFVHPSAFPESAGPCASFSCPRFVVRCDSGRVTVERAGECWQP